MEDCFIGIWRIKDDGSMEYTWEPEENLSPLDKKYKSYCPLETEKELWLLIEDRVPDMRRPGLSPFLARIGCNMQSTPLEIFIKNHGFSINDLFWVNTEKDNSLWYKWERWK